MPFLNKLLMWLKRGPPISRADTALVKYIFLDVVGFTKDRSVEAQSDIISTFNRMIKEVISDHSVPNNQLIVLPSGDGLCLALVDLPHPYDLSLVIALDIIQRLDSYNSMIKDAKRFFQIRMGLSENVDNLITDFNGNPNVAGAGINLARAIMENADGGQILIDQNGYNTLRPREKYEGAFRGYNAKGKHGQTFNIYQYIKSGHNGLNIDAPSAFAKRQSVDPPFNQIS